MAFEQYSVRVPGRVPDALAWVTSSGRERHEASSEPPEKRRRIDRNRPCIDLQHAADILPQYIAIGKIEMLLEFDKPPLNPSLNDKHELDVPVVALVRNPHHTRPGVNLALWTSTHEVLLEEVEGLDSRLENCLVDALRTSISNSTSIYCAHGKLPAVYSQTHLKRGPDAQTGFYVLETRILWINSAEIRYTIPEFALKALWQYYKTQLDLPEDSSYPPHPLPKLYPHVEPPQLGLSDFYDNVHVPPTQQHVPQIEGLDLIKCSLFPFQKRTVSWLLTREGMDILPDGTLRPREVSEEIPLSFSRVLDADGRPCYVSLLFRVVIRNLSSWNHAERRLRGGILAEEMGLGKTVEMLSLICAHQRPDIINGSYPPTPAGLLESRATLIITPPSILKQWQQEIAIHAPGLRVKHYTGLKKSKVDDRELTHDLASYDIVLMTYKVLNTEIYYAEDPPDRPSRHAKQAPKRKSPLMQISWWRVCIDEAQMVESQSSKPARVARIIPRCNAWAMTGTPLRKDIEDIYGLLSFLHYEPFCLSASIWKRVCTYPPVFKSMIRKIALRHNKEIVSRELRLPKQKRVVITIPFTAVEEQHYDQLFQQMCEECDLDRSGTPKSFEWDAQLIQPQTRAVIAKMRSWLSRLRQACLQPKVDTATARTLGSNGPLRSVADVLAVMIDQNETKIRTEERTLLISQIRRGQIMENALRPRESLEIWKDAARRSGLIVKGCRNQLDEELKRRAELAKESVTKNEVNGDDNEEDEDSGDDESENELLNRLGVLRHRLRTALEIEHMCEFFMANAYYQIKTDPEITEPDSDSFRELEKQEENGYEVAKLIRREMLADTIQMVNGQINRLKVKVQKDGVYHVPTMSTALHSVGIESRRLLDQVEDFCDAMKPHTDTFNKWLDHMAQLLLQALVDEEEGSELKGDEYESSTKHQDEMYVYMEGLRVMFARHFAAITGQVNNLITHEVGVAMERAKMGEGPAPELYISLINKCEELKLPRGQLSLRGLVNELRNLVVSLERQEIQGSSRARAEQLIVKDILREVSKLFSVQSKAIPPLEKQMELFRSVMNKRLEYYRQLQQISDTVAPYDEDRKGKPLNEEDFVTKLEAEKEIDSKLSSLKAKHRYLLHLRDESGTDENTRVCIICDSTFDIGVLTICGHKFCKDCIRHWWRQSQSCPVCKSRLKMRDFHEITYKPQEIVAQEENAPNSEPGNPQKNPIYSDISSKVLEEIQNIDLPRSYGTKIDTLCRHLLWLRQHDPGAKSIVFSQNKSFLVTLSHVFYWFKIGHSSIDDPSGIERFKEDHTTECFLLHAKAHASGLNLVNATHVFLCEPLINTAIELQAIARVHRIGQHQDTTVWMYLVANTVEESIYQISVARRLAHIARRREENLKKREHSVSSSFISESYLDLDGNGHAESNGTSHNPLMSLRHLDENTLESANSHELEDVTPGNLFSGPGAEGEKVRDLDVWQCLFSNQKRNGTLSNEVADAETMGDVENDVRRVLRATAAEARQLNVQMP
ncbi:SNF2 family helicase/ATPase [Trichophyton violaceum]|uniref:SNF2 family helicase/ATPase n=1 Tax=Trichophyton violaceum TaxID=34388 RepID=A0A178FDA9_TRIVO|nr:SNF2 family helicase/ATPase [Trichophyton violaceum]